MRPLITTGDLIKHNKCAYRNRIGDKKIPHKAIALWGFYYRSDYLTTFNAGRAFAGASDLGTGFFGSGG